MCIGPQRQYATAFRLPDRIIIESVAITLAGFGIGSEPYFVLAKNASPLEIGEALLNALAESKPTFETKIDYKALITRLLKAAGVSSYRRFVQRAICCQIEQESHRISIYPTKNGGTRGNKKGFQGQPGVSPITVEIEAPAEQVGVALRQAFDACSSIYPIEDIQRVSKQV
jgi:hypothetical protein